MSDAIDPQEVTDFLESLDEAGERLREVLDTEAAEDSPAIQFYLDGSTFIEAGYVLVEQLSKDFPGVYRALVLDHYRPAFERARRGQIAWSEALATLPEFLRQFAEDRVHQELFTEDADEA